MQHVAKKGSFHALPFAHALLAMVLLAATFEPLNSQKIGMKSVIIFMYKKLVNLYNAKDYSSFVFSISLYRWFRPRAFLTG